MIKGKKSTIFERKISRVYQLLSDQGTLVSWNDTVHSTSDPQRPRQVDVLIRKGEKTIHVECRAHKKRQDVKWVEELIGRKVNLAADMMIGVSSSGFTDGARKAARLHGIILRDLLTMTDEEVMRWGTEILCDVAFIKYDQLSIHGVFAKDSQRCIESNAFAHFLLNQPVLNELFEHNRKVLLSQGLDNDRRGFVSKFNPKDLRLHDQPVQSIILKANIKLIRQQLKIMTVQIFGDPTMPKEERNVYIQKMSLKNFEFSRHYDDYYLCMDLSSIKPPGGAQFFDIRLDMGHPGTLKGMEIYADKLPVSELRKVAVNVAFDDVSKVLDYLTGSMGVLSPIADFEVQQECKRYDE
jgi:hypothetical protein